MPESSNKAADDSKKGRAAASSEAKPASEKAPVAATAVDQPTNINSKEETLASAQTPDYFATMTEMQSHAKDAFEKGTVAMGEATDFAKGNADAFVECTKIFTESVQELSQSSVAEAKSAYDLLTADIEGMTGAKTPIELFELQTRILLRSFETYVATSAKNAEALTKLTHDTFAPISERFNVARKKLPKAA